MTHSASKESSLPDSKHIEENPEDKTEEFDSKPNEDDPEEEVAQVEDNEKSEEEQEPEQEEVEDKSNEIHSGGDEEVLDEEEEVKSENSTEKRASDIENVSKSSHHTTREESTMELRRHVQSKEYADKYTSVRKSLELEALIQDGLVEGDENNVDKSVTEVGDVSKAQLQSGKLSIKCNQLQSLTAHFQKMLGPTPPIVKDHALQLRNSHESIPVILVMPTALGDILAIIRAARFMKLHVRCCGNLTSFDAAVYTDEYNVLIQTTNLCDSERIELFKFQKTDGSSIHAVRVLAGVSIKEFTAFQEKNKFHIRTSVEDTTHTVVGSIVAGRHTTVSIDANKHLATLADLVLQIRIVNSDSDLITFVDDGYDEEPKLKTVVTNLGMLGVVYDVVIGIAAYTLTEVSHEYATLNGILKDPYKVMERVSGRYGVQLLYIPFNSHPQTEDLNASGIWKWDPRKDEILIRKIDTIASVSSILGFPRKSIDLIREPGPEYTFLNYPLSTPNATSSTFKEINIQFKDIDRQTLPWSIHCYSELPYSCNDLTFSIPVGADGKEIAQILSIITDTFQIRALFDNNYALNVCVRISFTGVTDIYLCPGKSSESGSATIAHIRMTGVRKAAVPNKCWNDIAKDVGKRVMAEIPSAVPQWTTEWSTIDGVEERLLKTYSDGLQEFQLAMNKMDRDGVFLTSQLRDIFCKEGLGEYRSQYIEQRSEEIAKWIT